jgi:hypothetical protein
LTNDYRHGWRKKLRWDRNQRRRRAPAVRRRVRAFKVKSRRRRCTSRARSSCVGPLQVHHVGGLSSRARLTWRCAKHNQRAAGNRPRRFRHPRKR